MENLEKEEAKEYRITFGQKYTPEEWRLAMVYSIIIVLISMGILLFIELLDKL